MSPVVAYKLWKTYVIPRALYGIKVMNHTASDIIQLEKLQRKISGADPGEGHPAPRPKIGKNMNFGVKS